MSALPLRLAMIGAALLFGAIRAAADPLTGDTGAAASTAQAVGINPANAGFVDRTELTVSPELFKSESLQIRYPNASTVSETESGLGGILSMGKPGFVWKPTKNLGVAGYAVPPIGLGAEIKKEGIPVVILGTQDTVDLDAKGTVDGAFGLTAGYRFGDRLGVGASASYTAVSFSAKLIPSGSTEPLATIDGSTSDFNLSVGLRYDPKPGKLAVGVAFGLVNMHTEEMQIESDLLNAVPAGDDSGVGAETEARDDGASVQVANPLNAFTVGIQVAASRLRLLADVRYTRVNKEQEAFSIVDLKKKRKDLYDTVGVNAGIIMALSETADMLFGFQYQPASLGAGAKATETDAGSIGFGTQEVVMIFAGMGSLTPYWQVGAGLNFDFGRDKKFNRWSVSSGLVYRRASLGIDEDGELPGAYLYQKTFIPVTVTYRL